MALAGCDSVNGPAAPTESKLQQRRAEGRENGRYQAIGKRQYTDAYAIFLLDTQTGRTCAVLFTFDEKQPDSLRCAPTPRDLDMVGSN